MNFYSLVCVLKRGIMVKVILGSILCTENERHNEIGYQWKGSSIWRWVWKLLINVTYEDVSTIFVLLVPCLAVLHTHLQHPFIHFLNVFDVSVKSNTLITINSTLNWQLCEQIWDEDWQPCNDTYICTSNTGERINIEWEILTKHQPRSLEVGCIICQQRTHIYRRTISNVSIFVKLRWSIVYFLSKKGLVKVNYSR